MAASEVVHQLRKQQIERWQCQKNPMQRMLNHALDSVTNDRVRRIKSGGTRSASAADAALFTLTATDLLTIDTKLKPSSAASVKQRPIAADRWEHDRHTTQSADMHEDVSSSFVERMETGQKPTNQQRGQQRQRRRRDRRSSSSRKRSGTLHSSSANTRIPFDGQPPPPPPPA